MKRKFYTLISLLLFIIITYSCEKNDEMRIEGKNVEIYQIESFKTEDGTDKIFEPSIILSQKPLITYNEILSYNPDEHTFILSESTIETFNQDGGIRYHFKAFALTVDGKIIYTGYFWPPYASSIKQWFVADPVSVLTDKFLKIDLAYPTNNFAGPYPDNRNDQRIIDVLQKDDKIIN